MIKQITETKEYKFDNVRITVKHVNGHLDGITITNDYVGYYTFDNFEEAEQIFNKLKVIKEEFDG